MGGDRAEGLANNRPHLTAPSSPLRSMPSTHVQLSLHIDDRLSCNSKDAVWLVRGMMGRSAWLLWLGIHCNVSCVAAGTMHLLIEPGEEGQGIVSGYVKIDYVFEKVSRSYRGLLSYIHMQP